jgi:uncharacterized protein
MRGDGPPLGVGFSLHADPTFLDWVAPVLDEADWFEVAPETTWREDRGKLSRNDYHALFARLAAGRPVVAHGLAFSLGTPLAGDEERTRAWVERLRDDHETFGFAWASDHLGFSFADGLCATLPLPLPFTPEAVDVVAGRLRRLRDAVSVVAFENNVGYFAMGDPLDEPAFLNAIARAADARIVLDLHNVWTQCRNLGVDADAWVDRLDLDRVIEVHVSGGGDSDPAWLASRRAFRLDSHDHTVPEEVWSLLERTLPRCCRVRGLLLERMNGTVGRGDDGNGVPALLGELDRAKETWRCSPTCSAR